MISMEKLCNICPRNCNINREKQVGFCKATNKPKVSKVMLHYYEEPPISGEEETGTLNNGSGAIFFSSCNLKCVYCQNYDISDGGIGKEISIEKLADIFKQLEDAGANNINLVTPTHYTLQIIQALDIYKPKIPIVWNTSGYEKPETIQLLKNYVDIYLTDFKYMDNHLAKTLSNAENYPEICKQATLEMRKNQPNDIFENGLMKKGMIIRHLVLPTQTKNSLEIVDWIYKNLGNKTYLSLMAQYTPMSKAKSMDGFNRKITPLEYKILINKVQNLKFENVFYQDLESADSSFTPNFKENDKKFNL
ncbi:MAG: radical SAM protein [Clostridia bacterium]|nr:radical SAM protein [Clostridia bacterium]